LFAAFSEEVVGPKNFPEMLLSDISRLRLRTGANVLYWTWAVGKKVKADCVTEHPATLYILMFGRNNGCNVQKMTVPNISIAYARDGAS
jgi:hypothetical protein